MWHKKAIVFRFSQINMRITYVIDTLASKGGAERIIIEKMNYLASHFGYEVSVICCYQCEGDVNAYPLSDKVSQIYLHVPFYSQYQYPYPYRLWVKRNLNQALRRELLQEVFRIDPDILIYTSYFRADVICKINCRAKKVVEAHEPRLFTLSNEGLGRSFLVKMYMVLYRKFYFRTVERYADVVVTLTDGDAYAWRRANRVMVIRNFSSLSVNRRSDVSAKRVIAVGRLEWVKGFDRLINAWAIVSKQHPDWKLDIFGEGTLEGELKKQIQELNQSNCIEIHPFTSDIHEEYAKSSILVSSSHFEGFSLAILEALRIGVPCVAFDCPYGPRTIIKNNKCGFFVPDGNKLALADRINRLIDNPEMRRSFSKAGVLRAEFFKINVVMNQWKNFFENLVKGKVTSLF